MSVLSSVIDNLFKIGLRLNDSSALLRGKQPEMSAARS
jgi:hypothetical protein